MSLGNLFSALARDAKERLSASRPREAPPPEPLNLRLGGFVEIDTLPYRMLAERANFELEELAQLDLGLRGEACGDLGVRSAFGWAEDGRSLRLAAPAFAEGERERAAGGALVPETLVTSLGQVRFAPPVPPESLKDLVPTIASSMSAKTSRSRRGSASHNA